MNKPTRTLTILFLLAACSLLPQPVRAASQGGLLLRWQDHVDYEFISDSETLIYRDGLVIVKSMRSGEDRVSLSRGLADPLELARLKQALSDNRVGILRANGCKAAPHGPTGFQYTAILTWFGNAGRQNRLEINTNPVTLCSTEVNNVVFALDELWSHITYVELVQTIP
jgi:hypothetical protein